MAKLAKRANLPMPEVAIYDRASLVDAVTVNDLPAPGLLEQAEAGAALLVVGSRGLGSVKGILLGSVSRTVVERSPIPVVVVPHA